MVCAEIMVMELKGKLTGKGFLSLEIGDDLWWAVLDSNQQPSVCETGTQYFIIEFTFWAKYGSKLSENC